LFTGAAGVAQGETSAFNVRDFPTALREEIVREAKAADMSVGEFLTAVCLAAREAGWSRAVVLTGDVNRYTPVSASEKIPEWRLLLDILSTSHSPQWLRAGAARKVGALIGLEPPKAPKRLPAGNPLQFERESPQN
jgi:hypothetical protein